MVPARRIPLLAVLASFTLTIVGCSSPTEAELLLDGVDRAEARWLANRADVYHVSQRRVCECLPEETAEVVLRVELNLLSEAPVEPEMIVSGTYAASGDPVPEELLDRWLTVQALFALLRAAIADGAHTVRADFDPVLGYPTEVEILPDPQIPDGGARYILELVEPEG